MGRDLVGWADQFSLPLVGLALLVCCAGSTTVLALLDRARAARGAPRWMWLCGVGIGFGADVWATHFIAMLAYAPGAPCAYRVWPTLLSIAIATVCGVPCFALVVSRRGGPASRLLAGPALGLVIGAMHFVGMSALRLPMPAMQSLPFTLAAFAIGMGFCTAALWANQALAKPLAGRLATLCLIVAICGLHFTAMGGFVTKMPTAMTHVAMAGGAASNLWLALTVAGVSLLILLSAFSAVVADVKIVDLRQREATALQHLARHDELTNLPNRSFLRERLAQALAAPSEMRDFALFYIDLDRFKPVNDLYGHFAGDRVLAEMAARIQGLIRGSDMVARFGGDEFIILQRGSTHPASAAALAERLVRRLAEPVLFEGRALQVGASIGIAFYPSQAATIDDVIRNADIALYRAKSDGGGCFRFFAPEMSERLLAQRTLQQDLLAGLERGEFQLAYQPIFDCETGRLAGFEALLRWCHPVRGMVPPMEFIPFAESSGLIGKLGAWVLETACREAAGWPGWVHIAINLSPVQLRRTDLDESVLDVLARTGLDPARLELEITENALIETPEQARATMLSLKTRGLRFAIDDFGTGYSSLSSLHSFPFDRIKIDRSFVNGMEFDSDLTAISRAIISLGEALGITVVAEGVETPEQLALLRGQKCGHVQGFFVGRPTFAAGAAALIAAQLQPGPPDPATVQHLESAEPH